MAWGLFRKIKDGIKKGINKVKDFTKKAFGVAKKLVPEATKIANAVAPAIANNPYGQAALVGLNGANAVIQTNDTAEGAIRDAAQQYGPLLRQKIKI